MKCNDIPSQSFSFIYQEYCSFHVEQLLHQEKLSISNATVCTFIIHDDIINQAAHVFWLTPF